MSYCRWSSDDFKCDLYCYKDVSGGYKTHVADRRIVGDIPHAQEKQDAFLETAKMRRIKLPYHGQSFNDPDLKSFLKRLLDLRQIGYNFPDDVLNRVKEELKLKKRRRLQ